MLNDFRFYSIYQPAVKVVLHIQKVLQAISRDVKALVIPFL